MKKKPNKPDSPNAAIALQFDSGHCWRGVGDPGRCYFARFMKSKFQFSRLDMTMLVLNTLAFGACLVLLLLGRASGPLILLTIGALGMIVGKLGRAYFRAQQSASAPPTIKQH